MESYKNDTLLLESGFMPEQIAKLRQFYSVYVERMHLQIMEEQRRLEFARWLVSTGRMTDELPVKA